jgi:putative RecB family exonuclease
MPTYSHSRLGSFESCPLSYKLCYIEDVDIEEEEGIEAYVGSRVHDVLEKLYHDKMHSKENSVEELLGFYDDEWLRNWHDNIRIVRKQYTAENYKDTGERCIQDYYRRYKPFDQSKTLALEKKIAMEIEGYKLTGYIDRLSHTRDGHYEIHDYKTARYLPTQKSFDEDRQLALYQIGVEELWRDAQEVDLIWHYLAHDKEIRSKRTNEQLDKLKNTIITLIQDIERATDEDNFPPNETGLCGWCSYTTLCPNYAYLARTADLPKNEFLKEPGVKLVNHYAKLTQDKKAYNYEVDTELEKLKEALITYSQKESLDVIRGNNQKVKVKRFTRKKLPSKSEVLRTELDRLLKELGLWPEVSDLNTSTLLKALEADPDLKKKIQKYLVEEESYRISLSKL